ncbi:MAG: helix-turn-helix domain-containing protein [Armatimonadetes bacterium]|nr:helix-turn-helix domain-containing protein [Armatimonadota bacterium]
MDLRQTPYLTVPQVAELLQVSEKTVLRLIKAEKLDAQRFGRQWRLPSAQFLPPAAGKPEAKQEAA